MLARAELFEGLDAAALTEIATAMRPREYEPGDELCRAGAAGERMLVIVDGLVHAHVEGRLTGRRRHGDVVGAAALAAGEPLAETVVARTPTLALELERDAFAAAIGRHPRILANVTRILGQRLQSVARREAHALERGEAVALVTSPALAACVPDLVAATAAASPRPADSMDTVVSLQDRLATLDERLLEHGTVLALAGLHQDALPLVLEHTDRAVALVTNAAEAEQLRALDPGLAGRGPQAIEVVLVEPGAAGPWPSEAGGMRVLRRLDRAEGGAPLDSADVAWLGRHLARTKLGLALGAGGAKGFAHVGALGVLERAGYTVDCVSGSSIGATVATCVALGMVASEIESTLRTAFTPEHVAELFSLSLAGGSTGLEAMERSLREVAGERSFEDLVMPLAIMAVDLDAAVPAPLREGLLWRALMGSAALAGMFPPYELDGRRLVDGLALVPVPTGCLEEDGADVTVSVNLMSRDVLPAWPGDDPLPEEPAVVKKRGSRMLETLLAVMDLANLDSSVRHAALADVVVTPRFGPSSWKDFHLADLFQEAGRQAAEERIAELQALARPQRQAVTI